MDADLAVFFLLSAVEVGAAYLVVSSKRLVHSVLWLSITLVTIGGIYILLRAELIGLLQIIVYAGGVPVLFLFGIMLTRRKIMEEPHEAD